MMTSHLQAAPKPAILYVHDLRGSGVVVNAIALARRLGHERETILCAGYDGGLFDAVDVAPARLVSLHVAADASRRFGASLKLRRLVRASDAGLVVSMGNFGHRTMFYATLGLGVHKVYRVSNAIGRPVRGMKNFRRTARHWLQLASADKVVLVGRALAELPLFKRARKRGRAAYIANGVDIAAAHAAASAPCPHPWLEDGGAPVVLTVGRIHPQKNLDGLIEAAGIAARTCPLRLIVVGGGPAEERARLEQVAAAKGIGEAVLFAGETDNVFAWLKRADLFALASFWEGSSTALLEALAIGVPVVASREAGDAAYVLGEGEFGALVEASDPAGIAEAILRQLSPGRIEPGNRVERFALERTHAEYLDLFGRL